VRPLSLSRSLSLAAHLAHAPSPRHSRLPYLQHTLPYAPSSCSLHPSRSTFVTGASGDEWVRVHDAVTGQEREVAKGHHGPVHCVAYSPDGECFASGSEDGASLSLFLVVEPDPLKRSLLTLSSFLSYAGTVRLWQTAPKTYGLWRYAELEEGAEA